MNRANDPAQLAPPLVGWFRAGARELPWREDRTPYRVWVSEVMLQQTQVDTVVRYYDRFLARFPTIAALAEAPLDEVLAAWSGLGFYRRARSLHRAARQVVDVHGGLLPRDPRALLGLPGVGRYTAGAIRSLAWGDRAPILDGNVARVLSRVFRVAGPLAAPATQRRLWGLAEEVLPEADVGAMNEALMELGALVCRPRAPRCDACPIASSCGAFRRGDPEAFPETAPTAAVPTDRRVALFVQRGDGRFRLERRPEEGLLAGLYELPTVALREGEHSAEAARRSARGLGIGAAPSPCGVAEHRFSHRRWEVAVYRVRTRARRALAGGRWTGRAELAGLALPTATLKVLRVAWGDDPAQGRRA